MFKSSKLQIVKSFHDFLCVITVNRITINVLSKVSLYRQMIKTMVQKYLIHAKRKKK